MKVMRSQKILIFSSIEHLKLVLICTLEGQITLGIVAAKDNGILNIFRFLLAKFIIEVYNNLQVFYVPPSAILDNSYWTIDIRATLHQEAGPISL